VEEVGEDSRRRKSLAQPIKKNSERKARILPVHLVLRQLLWTKRSCQKPARRESSSDLEVTAFAYREGGDRQARRSAGSGELPRETDRLSVRRWFCPAIRALRRQERVPGLTFDFVKKRKANAQPAI